jgi:hypothetical protein
MNQSAFSLYFFMRDIADRDFVGWLESVIVAARHNADDFGQIQIAVLRPLQHLFGLSTKMLTMILSDLLIGGSRIRPTWLEVGAGMIVVDTLVHNFMHPVRASEAFSLFRDRQSCGRIRRILRLPCGITRDDRSWTCRDSRH